MVLINGYLIYKFIVKISNLDCTKQRNSEKNNPLLLTSHFPFNGQRDHATNNILDDDSLLYHALISYALNGTKFMIFSFDQNKWSLINQQQNSTIDLTTINYFTSLTTANTSTFTTDIVHKVH